MRVLEIENELSSENESLCFSLQLQLAGQDNRTNLSAVEDSKYCEIPFARSPRYDPRSGASLMSVLACTF